MDGLARSPLEAVAPALFFKIFDIPFEKRSLATDVWLLHLSQSVSSPSQSGLPSFSRHDLQ